MNITIIMLGGTSIVNTGDHNTLMIGAAANWNHLQELMTTHGVAQEDIAELKQIV